ncbi:LodA/GoxA family CTQ-dependent oxidase [Salsipaludibacter albus]|uniref:LodA/GoxA family CTQ-dependent oxidase n=1 Tax=Salsipaludibacter albus TaxID=2849650 RepID=UPI001EE3DF43|nr:LodA/GoxA family CTQ-dependent oxidase [Salsipaludibacter albus]
MASTFRIHPAIGIARVGNSPEWFVGPELVGGRPNPQGGFKDDKCRVKRQAARFRIFEHFDDGTAVEVSGADHDIQWSVHVANAKAAHPARGNAGSAADLTIDPGRKRIDGPAGQVPLDGGQITFDGQPTVPVSLGQLLTDGVARLYVLGGRGAAGSPAHEGMGSYWYNSCWWDDVSDGPVSARLRRKGTTDWTAAAPAWVIVGPPKFAPDQDSITTLYDRVLAEMVACGMVPMPATTSYTRDVHPILQRARDIAWVHDIGDHHSDPTWWVEPMTSLDQRNHVFSWITAPSSPASFNVMPKLSKRDARVTQVQYTHLERWHAGQFVDDWQGPPEAQWPVTPDGLTRAALEACVGGPFFPGIEAGGLPDHGLAPVVDDTKYVEPFRLDVRALVPGDLIRGMALPWQADFAACAGSWWPVPRPDDVRAPGATTSHPWVPVNDYGHMLRTWDRRGFVLHEGDAHVEREVCTQPILFPHSSHLLALGGDTGGPAETTVAFDVIAADGGDHRVTLEIERTRRVRGRRARMVQGWSGAVRRVVVPVEVDRGGRARTETVVVVDRGSRTRWPVTVAVPSASGPTPGSVPEEGAPADDLALHRWVSRLADGRPVATIVRGRVPVGVLQRLPVFVTELDDHVEVVVRSADPERFDVRVQSPLGRLLEPWAAAADDRLLHRRDAESTRFGIRLPFGPEGREERRGVWHVLVRQGRPCDARTDGSEDGTDPTVLEGMGDGGIGRMALQPSRGDPTDGPALGCDVVAVVAGGPTPAVAVDRHGTSATIRLAVDLPAGAPRPDAWLAWRGRAGRVVEHDLEPVDDATFEARVPAGAAPAVVGRLRLTGVSPVGTPFAREATVRLGDG